jgi:hypothetical protein
VKVASRNGVGRPKTAIDLSGYVTPSIAGKTIIEIFLDIG